MPRIAIAGFQHETNTFAPSLADIEDFRMADSWPELLRGQTVIEQTRGMNLPIAGATLTAEAQSADLIPILWCAAEPSGYVTDDAFEWVMKMLLQGLVSAGPLDGIYLDLHGAMVTQSHPDGEGEVLRRVRAAVGDNTPIGVSLDLHANLTQQIVDLADRITIYRTYPHLDMADTGARAMVGLLDHLGGRVLHAAFRQAPFLLPLHAQFTGHPPCSTLYEILETPEYADIALGFTAADIADCGPSVLSYATTPQLAQERADRLVTMFNAQEPSFDTTLLDAAEAVEQALLSRAAHPVVIADVQDNPGAGGTSDTTGVLQALLDVGATNALLGVMHDPDFAAMAHRAGRGATINAALGGKSGLPGQAAITAEFRVEHLSDGRFTYSGDMYGGGVATVGPSCLVSIEGVQIVVSSVRTQCLDLAFFTHFGLDPSSASIICVKSTVHFRADFEPIAARVINAKAPGAFACDLAEVPYQNLRRGMRLGPNGPTF